MERKKNPKADIERTRLGIGLLGLLVATAVILSAFEFRVIEDGPADLGDLSMDGLEEEIPEITQPEVKPPPPPPKPTTVIEIVDDEEEIEEELEVEDLEVDEETEIEVIEEVEEEIVEEEIFKIVEQMPAFPGCENESNNQAKQACAQKELFKYLGKNIKYPSMAKDAGIAGKVYVTFVVEKDGSIADVKLLRGIGGGCDEEAIRVVKKMPKWNAGKQRGKPVRVQFNLPVKFTLR